MHTTFAYDPILQNVDDINNIIQIQTRVNGILNLYGIDVYDEDLFLNELIYCLNHPPVNSKVSELHKNTIGNSRISNFTVDVLIFYILNKLYRVDLNLLDVNFLPTLRDIKVVGAVPSERLYEIRLKLTNLFTEVQQCLKLSAESIRGFSNGELLDYVKTLGVTHFNDEVVDNFSNHRDLLLSIIKLKDVNFRELGILNIKGSENVNPHKTFLNLPTVMDVIRSDEVERIKKRVTKTLKLKDLY